MTTWHITIATYGSRFHGEERPTVDRLHNAFGAPFLPPDSARVRAEQASMSAAGVEFSREQQVFVESAIPGICERGGWRFRACAAAMNHVHCVLDVEPRIHGQQVRRLLKRWLSEALSARWDCARRSDGMSWWSDGGSNRAVKDEAYLDAVVRYVVEQRATGRTDGEDAGRGLRPMPERVLRAFGVRGGDAPAHGELGRGKDAPAHGGSDRGGDAPAHDS